MIGRRIGSYRILERIGEGGMGVVYRARDETLERDVAIKVLAPGSADVSLLRRFRREALALSRLDHPNIETIHHLDTIDGGDCLILELVSGEPLDAVLARGPLPEREVLRLGIQLASGLEAAHASGVVHRDLKPANLRLTGDGRLKIIDFGLALELDSDATTLTRSSEFAGTLAYMAPEQLDGRRADKRTDIWGAGMVLYEMVTGARPFEDSSTAATMYRILNESPTPPRERNARASAALDQVILKALEKDPGRRYAHASDLRVDLERILAPTATTPPRRSSRTWRRWVPTAIALVGVMAIAVGAWLLKRGTAPVPATREVEAIAVLPLANMSGDRGQDYFADGMTDELITTLARIGAVRVIARTSVMPYKDSRKSLRQVARELHVDALVEGSVALAGDQVRVNANLIRGRDETRLWGDSYQRTLANVLTLQSDVARAITHEIQVRLTPDQFARLGASRTVVPEAYRLNLQGRELVAKLDLAPVQAGMALLRQSIALDSTYAPPHVDLAFGYSLLSSALYPPNEMGPLIRAEAARALQLDPELAEAHAMMGEAQVSFDYDWQGAEASLRRALELNPGSATAHLLYGLLLRCRGRVDEDRLHTRAAYDLDPRSEFASAQLGWVELFAGRYTEARAAFEASLKVFPNTAVSHAGLGLSQQFLGDTTRAIAELERAVAANAWPPHKAWLGYLVAHRDPSRARRILAEFDRNPGTGYVGACDRALVHLGLGERDSALTLIERGVEEHDEWMGFIAVDPRFDELRTSPRFKAVLHKVGLEDVRRTGTHQAGTSRQDRPLQSGAVGHRTM